MAVFSSLAEAQAYFARDRFAYGNGMRLEELSETRAVTSLTLTEEHRNALGGVMGGAIFTLADYASAALTNHLHSPAVAQQVSINYLNGVKGGRLTATAVCKKNGRNSMVTVVDVADDTGREVAQFTAVSFKLNPPPERREP